MLRARQPFPLRASDPGSLECYTGNTAFLPNFFCTNFWMSAVFVGEARVCHIAHVPSIHAV